jgi:serine/threonine protein kinase
MEGRAQAAASAEVLTGLLDDGALLRAELERENAAARDACQRQEAAMAGTTLAAGGGVAVGQRLGVSASRSQGMYGVNSVVYRVVVRGEEYALKAIITAYGPFAERDGAALEQAVRDELTQPPYSPHLLRYHSHFNGIVEGDVAREWPRDVQTTPVGSLTKFMLMPLLGEGNLQAYVRANPVREEGTFLVMVLQLLKGVIALVDAELLHRDIKLDNVLVRLDPEGGPPFLLLADFGTLQSMANQVGGCTPGNPMKVAPELRTLQDIGREAAAAVDLTKAEVWAVGALCFDILAAPAAPYEQLDSTSLPESPAVSVLGRAVVRRMLAWEVPQRLSALDAALWVVICQDRLADAERSAAAAAAALEQERVRF